MPGVIVALHVHLGDKVREGDRLVSVEAMKMEHVVTSPLDGQVAEVLVRGGDKVKLDALLIVIREGADAD
jgi:biotin carboxyl carrier protein